MDGDGPQPFEQFIGRLCEEFHCLPSQAFREWQRVPVGFMEQIIEYRAYANVKAHYDASVTPESRRTLVASSPLAQLVQEITFELAHG